MVFARLADAALADTLSPAGQAAEASAQFCWFLPRFGRKGIRDSVRSASNQWRDGSQLRRVSAKTAKCVECVAEWPFAPEAAAVQPELSPRRGGAEDGL